MPKDANVASDADDGKFNSHTARISGTKSKRRKKVQVIMDTLIEGYIKGGDFEQDWQFLPKEERVRIALEYCNKKHLPL